MKYIGGAFLALATMLCALTIAIAREGNMLAQYEWAVPYLVLAIIASLMLGAFCLRQSGRQQEKKT